MAKVQGLPSFRRKVRELRRLTNKGVARALLVAGDVIVREQVRLAPKDSGKLRDSIKAQHAGAEVRHAAFKGKGFLGSAGSEAKVTITAGGSDVRYAHLVEFGTKPHDIKPKNRKVLQLGPDSFSTKARHKGTQAQPFFYPGYRAARKKARSIIGKAVRAEIKSAVK